jgi:molybdopterin molybdotransferase
MTAAEQVALQPVEEYLAAALAGIRPLEPRELNLAEAPGAILASDITAQTPLPPFDNSAMDGYAVVASDVADATPDMPVTLPVRGEVAAGDTASHAVSPGSCLRITTGALMPAGADAVVQVELTDGGTEQVAIREPVPPGHAIRRGGDDAQPGALLLRSGSRLGPVQLGLLAATGHARVLARPRPRVTVMSTGDELAEPGETLVPGRIWESNSVLLTAAARQAGCPAIRHRPVPDDTDALLAAVQDALGGADLLVTSGGVSMGGEHDVVKAALSKLGTVNFRKVAMQPGMPQGFGTVGPDATPLFALPGNPVSAYVSFCLFVLPALDKLQDLQPERTSPTRAVLTASVRSPRGKRSFLRGIRQEDTVEPVSRQASHQLAALAQANALIVIPEPVTELAAGTEVDVLDLP